MIACPMTYDLYSNRIQSQFVLASLRNLLTLSILVYFHIPKGQQTVQKAHFSFVLYGEIFFFITGIVTQFYETHPSTNKRKKTCVSFYFHDS